MDIILLNTGPDWTDITSALSSAISILIGVVGVFLLIKTLNEQQKLTKEQELLTKEQEQIKEDNRVDIRLRNLPLFKFTELKHIHKNGRHNDFSFKMVVLNNTVSAFQIIYNIDNPEIKLSATGYDNGLMLIEGSFLQFDLYMGLPINGDYMLPYGKFGEFSLSFIDMLDNEYEQRVFFNDKEIVQEKAVFLGKLKNGEGVNFIPREF